MTLFSYLVGLIMGYALGWYGKKIQYLKVAKKEPTQ